MGPLGWYFGLLALWSAHRQDVVASVVCLGFMFMHLLIRELIAAPELDDE